jgi:arsenical pump membrane protein
VAVLAVGLLVFGIGGALVRPRALPAWIAPTIAALVALTTGVIDLGQIGDALRPLAPPLAFVAVAVPLAATLDDIGVFDALASIAARSRYVVGLLWIVAALVVAFLNLDAAVVLLTPLYVHTAVVIDADPIALAFQPVLLASLASGVLAVSNLTNLLAASQLSLTNGAFLRHLAPASIVACIVGWLIYRAVFRFEPHERAGLPRPDRRALVIGSSGIALFLVLVLGGERIGLPAWGAALVTEVALLAVTRRPPFRHIPAGTIVLAAALAVLAAGVTLALPHAFGDLGAGGVRGFAAGVVSANVCNNLPALLVGLPHVANVTRIWPLLLGVDLGPTLLITGSLAGLLWQASARRAGVEVSSLRYSRVGVVVGVPAMLAALAVMQVLG